MLSWLVCKNVKDQLTNEVLSGFSCAWVPYARPGEELTLAVQKALKEKSADIILLESHGLVVGGENCASTYSLMMQVLNRCHSKDKYNIHEVNSKNITLSKELNVRLPIYDEVHALALNDKLFEYCNDGTGVLYPDQAVFLGKKILCYQGNINDHNFLFFMKNHKSSSFVIVKGYGVLVSKDSKNDVDIMLRCHVRILSRLPENYNLNYLKESDIDRLLDWEPEKYRVRLDN